MAAEDGFTVRFVTLTGPDHVGYQYDASYYSHPTIVVGNGNPERSRFRVESETGLGKLAQYNDWQLKPLREEATRYLWEHGSLEWLNKS